MCVNRQVQSRCSGKDCDVLVIIILLLWFYENTYAHVYVLQYLYANECIFVHDLGRLGVLHLEGIP